MKGFTVWKIIRCVSLMSVTMYDYGACLHSILTLLQCIVYSRVIKHLVHYSVSKYTYILITNKNLSYLKRVQTDFYNHRPKHKCYQL